MFKVYFPFQWLVKGILLVLLGLILFGSYLTIKARHFPEEKPIKIVTKDLKIGETYQADGVELTFKNIEVTEKRNEFAQHDRVLQVTYTLINDTGNPIRPQQWSIENKDGEELYEYDMILDNPEYIESGKEETVNYYYELPIERQDYQIVVRRENGYIVGLPFTL
ncbi:TPA: hypothetical protein ACG8EX_002309 [Enterococcus faecium]|uniref:hypothetical protein n=1 Tax=Enterococcus faecium TaxID=1352 RepID=UPI001B0786B5|nr:hypothetical protein [Enterococcus faecium]MCE3121198.1 hypothetical protein [Enterococcus faecium]MCU2033855.1 hypothetical protein [Enterococcus faecium]MCU2140248.1 hypothetical protein [Enterococcus faecium]MCZ1189522.1 hypothetical protein [Enterococcus faecium]MCZ1469021.1 hypothetical protein [Enterococcus faecium]